MYTLVKDFVHKSPRYLRNFKTKEEYETKIRFPYEKEFSQKKQEQLSVDAQDIKLLKMLHENARLSLTEIGKK